MASIFLGAAVTISATTGSGPSSKKHNDIFDEQQVKLRVSLKQDSLKRVPSCQHTFSQMELTNTVSSALM